jgi:DNA-binding transcriptional regulator YdaS (Cro superfamily)
VDVLLAYLNSLSTEEQQAFAAAAETTVGYLRKACSIKQTLGLELCVFIEEASGGKVTRRDLRPEDWQRMWPELRTQAVG